MESQVKPGRRVARSGMGRLFHIKECQPGEYDLALMLSILQGKVKHRLFAEHRADAAVTG
jgi:hypothetical protein